MHLLKPYHMDQIALIVSQSIAAAQGLAPAAGRPASTSRRSAGCGRLLHLLLQLRLGHPGAMEACAAFS